MIYPRNKLTIIQGCFMLVLDVKDGWKRLRRLLLIKVGYEVQHEEDILPQ